MNKFHKYLQVGVLAALMLPAISSYAEWTADGIRGKIHLTVASGVGAWEAENEEEVTVRFHVDNTMDVMPVAEKDAGFFSCDIIARGQTLFGRPRIMGASWIECLDSRKHVYAEDGELHGEITPVDIPDWPKSSPIKAGTGAVLTVRPPVSDCKAADGK
jgi:hypothetical protein